MPMHWRWPPLSLTPLPRHRGIALRAVLDQRGDGGLLRRFPHPPEINLRLRYSKSDVGREAGITQIDLLRMSTPVSCR